MDSTFLIGVIGALATIFSLFVFKDKRYRNIVAVSLLILTFLLVVRELDVGKEFIADLFNSEQSNHSQIIETPDSEELNEEPVMIKQVIGHKTIQNEGSAQINLLNNQVAIGSADKYQDLLNQDNPQFTIFVIRGPIDSEITIYWGGWDIWENISEEEILDEMTKKVDQLKIDHPDHYKTRGYRLISCESSIINCEILETYP
jgi:hypothetical protein